MNGKNIARKEENPSQLNYLHSSPLIDCFNDVADHLELKDFSIPQKSAGPK